MRSLIFGLLLAALLPAAAQARSASAPVRDPTVLSDRHIAFKLVGGGKWLPVRGLSENTLALGSYQAALSSSCFVDFELRGNVVQRRPRLRGDQLDLPGSGDLRVRRTGRHAGFTWWTGNRPGLFAAIGAALPMQDGRYLVVSGGLVEASDAPRTSRACARRIRSVAGPIVRTAATSLRLAKGPVPR